MEQESELELGYSVSLLNERQNLQAQIKMRNLMSRRLTGFDSNGKRIIQETSDCLSKLSCDFLPSFASNICSAFKNNQTKVPQTELTNWTVHPTFGKPGVMLSGTGKDGKMRKSSVITLRLKQRMIVSETNIVYLLNGPLNDKEKQLPPDIRVAFANGFPSNWKAEVKRLLEWNEEEQRLTELQSSGIKLQLNNNIRDSVKADDADNKAGPSLIDTPGEISNAIHDGSTSPPVEKDILIPHPANECNLSENNDVSSEHLHTDRNKSPTINTIQTQDINVHGKITPENNVKPEKKEKIEIKNTKKKLPLKKEGIKLTNWFVVLFHNLVLVEGLRNVDGVNKIFRTSPVQTITKRKRHIITKTGSVYILVGDIDITRSIHNGLTEQIARRFKKGFPKSWKKDLEKCSLENMTMSGSFYGAQNSILAVTEQMSRTRKISKESHDNLNIVKDMRNLFASPEQEQIKTTPKSNKKNLIEKVKKKNSPKAALISVTTSKEKISKARCNSECQLNKPPKVTTATGAKKQSEATKESKKSPLVKELVTISRRTRNKKDVVYFPKSPKVKKVAVKRKRKSQYRPREAMVAVDGKLPVLDITNIEAPAKKQKLDNYTPNKKKPLTPQKKQKSKPEKESIKSLKTGTWNSSERSKFKRILKGQSTDIDWETISKKMNRAIHDCKEENTKLFKCPKMGKSKNAKKTTETKSSNLIEITAKKGTVKQQEQIFQAYESMKPTEKLDNFFNFEKLPDCGDDFFADLKGLTATPSSTMPPADFTTPLFLKNSSAKMATTPGSEIAHQNELNYCYTPLVSRFTPEKQRLEKHKLNAQLQKQGFAKANLRKKQNSPKLVKNSQRKLITGVLKDLSNLNNSHLMDESTAEDDYFSS